MNPTTSPRRSGPAIFCGRARRRPTGKARRAFVAVLGLLAAGLVAGGPAASAAAPAPPIAVETNRIAELTFTSGRDRARPFLEIELDVVFQGPDGAGRRVPAFWAGGRLWRARFAAPRAGRYEYRTECSDPNDAGLHGRTGRIDVRPYEGSNPLHRHGPVRVAADHRHFEHLDGTPFFWLGDTWWMGLCERLKWPEDFKALAADRKAKGFNVVQIVAGLYPDMGAFDERGRNEAGFPWEKDYAGIRPQYFDRADERLFYLVEQGTVPCIVGAWGYHLPWLGVERMKKHWRYLVARYGALPVVWCAAGEVNLPYYLEKGFPQGGERQTAEWEKVVRYLRSINAFERPLTVHPTGLPPLSGRLLFADPALLDFDMLQTGHGQREVLPPTIRALRSSLAARPAMPVVNGEVAYEALLGRIPAEIPRLMFWANVLSGAAGHTYGANGIWQVNRPGRPYGNSPHGGNYGTLPWNEAMNLPGSRQLGLGKALLETLPWHRFEPHPEWASWQDKDKVKDKDKNKNKDRAAPDEFLVPYAAGVPKSVRVVYMPSARAVTVLGIEAGEPCSARAFDAITGRQTDLGPVRADEKGDWTQAPPREAQGDWVLVLVRPGALQPNRADRGPH